MTGSNSRNVQRPRLLILATLAEPGGVVTHLALLAPALVHNFDLVVSAYGPGPLPEAVTAAGGRFVPLQHVRRPLAPLRDVMGLVELIRLCRRERPAILYVNSAKAGVLGRIAGALTRVPIRIYGVHGWAFATHGGWSAGIYWLAELLTRPLTSATICVSESERARGLRARVCRAETTVVIRNGVEAREPRAPRDNPTTPHIISVGRLRTPKDFMTFVGALSRLPAGSFSAEIVGAGPDHDELVSEIERLGMGSSIALVGEREDVDARLDDADIFALSTLSEGLPMTVLEAMASGLPVVASHVGGVPELVEHELTGLLVPPRDPAAFAVALRRLVQSPDLRRRLGEAGRARVQREFEVGSFRQAHLDLYQRELATKGFAPPEAGN
jgi:glycosyltransferase involved in cell wall biosynthesis